MCGLAGGARGRWRGPARCPGRRSWCATFRWSVLLRRTGHPLADAREDVVRMWGWIRWALPGSTVSADGSLSVTDGPTDYRWVRGRCQEARGRFRMNAVDALERAVGRLARWGWPDDWYGGIISPDGLDDQVHCPPRDDSVDVATCRACERLIEVRSLSDGGGCVRMVICRSGQTDTNR